MNCGVIISQFPTLTSSDDWREKIQGLLFDFRIQFFSCCIILVTSTISTVFFLRLGISVEGDPVMQKQIASIAKSMGYTWGGIFSFMLMFFLVIPVKYFLGVLNEIYDERKLIETEGVSLQIFRQSIISPIIQPTLIVSSFSPFIFAILGGFIK